MAQDDELDVPATEVGQVLVPDTTERLLILVGNVLFGPLSPT